MKFGDFSINITDIVAIFLLLEVVILYIVFFSPPLELFKVIDRCDSILIFTQISI